MFRSKVLSLGLLLAVLLLAMTFGTVRASVIEFSTGLLSHISSKWGDSAVERLENWRETELQEKAQLRHSAVSLSKEQLQVFNQFWNRVPYYSDLKHWGVEDYWATPIETLASNGADCEDYSIAKYFSLKELGVPAENLRITYVRALRKNEAHMVLAYYPSPGADPYILDNLTGNLETASERDDLVPVYSFNDDDLWAVGAAAFRGKSRQIRLWGELLDKMDKEQLM
ncbi:MAG: transglutaminase-like cysteine peptidase [Gallionella sp.]